MDTPVTLWSESAAFPLLTTLTLVPLAAMAAILYARSTRVALRFGFAGTLLTLLLSIYLLAIFDSGNPGIHLVEQAHFAGLSYSVGVDGANILFIPLNGGFNVTGVGVHTDYPACHGPAVHCLLAGL